MVSENADFDGECIVNVENDGKPFARRIRWKNGLFTSFDDAPLESATKNTYYMPALFDPQVNGFAGVDFQQDDLSSDQLLHAVRELRRHACGGILLTLITDEWPKMMKRLAHIKSLRDANPELTEAIAGFHIEGPFLSAEDGFRGAHNPGLMIDPTPDHIRELHDLTSDCVTLLTLAPERPGAIQAIELAWKNEIKISIGHTNATNQQLRDALKAGALGFTHVGNGCPRTLDRQDNIIWRAVNSGLTLGIIPDTIHVSPDLFRIILSACASGEYSLTKRLYFTTDAMAAAGAPPGTYTIGKVKIDVGADGVVRLPGQPYFAGSALTPLQGVIRAARMLGKSPLDVEKYFSNKALWTHPLNDHGVTKPEFECGVGTPATFNLVCTGEGGNIVSGEMYVRGVPTPLHVEPRYA